MSNAATEEIKSDLIALKTSCIEAQNGTWDKSDDGFNDMFMTLERIQKNLAITDDTDYDAIMDSNEEDAA